MDESDLKTKFCSDCGYIHLDPLPSAEEVFRYYDEDHFYNDHSSISFLEKEQREYDLGLWNTAYNYQLDLFINHLPIIDIGTGLGTFVDYANKKRCWTTYGTEPSRIARGISPAEDWIYETLESLKHDRSGEFDYGANIRMSLVLEHLRDPYHFLSSHRDLLGSGRIMVIVPYDYNPLQKKVEGNWFVSKVHLNYFTPTSLRNLMYSAGLRVVYESATFPMEIFLLMGIDYRGNDKLGRKVHNLRLRFEKVFGILSFKLYRKLYQKYGWGRELIFVGEELSL